MPEGKACVGCGFCCRKAPCVVALRMYGNVTECPALDWDGKRYWCRLCQRIGPLAARYREELFIGAGCCCGLNTDRQNIPAPVPKKGLYKLPKELQVFIKHLMGNFCDSDKLHLIAMGVAKEMGKPEIEEAILRTGKEQQSRFMRDFVG